MSINVDFDHLFEQLPEVLSWIVPGLIFMLAYHHFRYEESNDEKESISILKAIYVSFFVRYAVIIVRSWFSSDWLWGLDENVCIAICSCIVAILLGGLFGWISTLSITKKFCEKFFNFTINSNPLFDLADKKNGCYVRVYLNQNKDECIFGMYSNCYNRGNEDWIVVKNAIRISVQPDEIDQEEYPNYEEKCLKKKIITKLLINTRDVQLIEYVYTEPQ